MSFKPSPPPDGCVQVNAHEAALTKIADEMESQARALEGNDRISMATKKELFLGAIRARKVAAELATHRLNLDHNQWLVAEARKLQGFDPTPRPRLKRKATP